MILNVSGRTDIPAFYSEWFMQRYNEGFVDVRNPFYYNQVSRINFIDVDAILFCSKNPEPIIKYLNDIKKPIIFHITLTPYNKDIEFGVPDKKTIINSIKKISDILGVDNVFVRYDPIFISDKYTIQYHIKAFDKMCSLLEGKVKHIIISFIDDYKNTRNNCKYLGIKELMETDYEELGVKFVEISRKYNMTVQTCFEDEKFLDYGFIKEECMSKQLAYRLTGKTNFKKWKARKEGKCSCVEMVDIGAYNSCKHFCRYCYANYDEKQVSNNVKKHNDKSSLLIGKLEKNDIIKERK